MNSVYTVIFYVFSFISVYVQIFFLVTFFDKRRKISWSPTDIELKNYPTVTVAVPCYNESTTIDKTIKSLLGLDYPKDKLTLLIVDDGSTDDTWDIIKNYDNGQNILCFHKENGGKHTAVNFALEKSTSEFFSCLDADSFVHRQTLKRIMRYFENDPRNMAVIPSVLSYDPKNLIQNAQKVEYDMGVYIKKMLGLVGGIQVTPGPLSTFRKKVFDELGPYRKAHNTEDQEIALRMQEHGYKIDYCPDAYVYTNTPDSIAKLYRQRLRWIYGFIKNLVDYRHLLFKKKYGTVALFTLPTGMVSIFGIVFVFFTIIYNLIHFMSNKIIEIKTIGFYHFFQLNYKFEWFFVNTKAMLFFSIILYILVIVSVLIGRKMSTGKANFSISIIYFSIIYSIVAPFWMLRAVYNALISKESSWIYERRITK